MLRTVYALYHSMHCTLYYYNDTFLRRLVNTTESANDLKIEKNKTKPKPSYTLSKLETNMCMMHFTQ